MADIRVSTGRVRLSFPKLAEPDPNHISGKPKYAATLLIPKTDTETYDRLKAAELAAVKEKFGGKIPKPLRVTIRDGDAEKDTDAHPEYKDSWFVGVSANATHAPAMFRLDRTRIDRDDLFESVQEITETFYAGSYAQVSLNPYAYDGGTGYSPGVSFGLRAVLALTDEKGDRGEPFGAAPVLLDADDEFI